MDFIRDDYEPLEGQEQEHGHGDGIEGGGEGISEGGWGCNSTQEGISDDSEFGGMITPDWNVMSTEEGISTEGMDEMPGFISTDESISTEGI